MSGIYPVSSILNFLYPQLAPQKSCWLTWRYAPSLHSWGGSGGGHPNLLNLVRYCCTSANSYRGHRAAPAGNPVDHLALPLYSHYVQAALLSPVDQGLLPLPIWRFLFSCTGPWV